MAVRAETGDKSHLGETQGCEYIDNGADVIYLPVPQPYLIEGWPVTYEALERINKAEELKALAEQPRQTINFLQALKRAITKKKAQKLDIVRGESLPPALGLNEAH